jgi:hypothetical protein
VRLDLSITSEGASTVDFPQWPECRSTTIDASRYAHVYSDRDQLLQRCVYLQKMLTTIMVEAVRIEPGSRAVLSSRSPSPLGTTELHVLLSSREVNAWGPSAPELNALP